METVRCHVKIMKKFPKFVFWNIFRLEATTDEIDVNTVPSFGENESHVPRRRAKLLTFFQKKKSGWHHTCRLRVSNVHTLF